MARADESFDRTPREQLFEALDRRLPYLFVAPAVLLVVGVLIYPVVWAIKLSLFEVSTYNLDRQVFVGLRHYLDILTTPLFYRVMVNTVVFVGASVIGQLTLGLGLALLLTRDWLGELSGAFRASYILPWATTGVIVAYSWQFMFNNRLGLINTVLRAVGVQQVPTWLGSVEWAMVAVIIANIWRGTPFSLVFQSSGLATIGETLYEAAAVAGASNWQKTRYVTIPLLRPFIWMNLVLITLFTVNVFDLIFVMTGGGPLESTEVLSLYMYEMAFQDGRFGRASALAVILFVINLTMVGFYLWASGRGGGRSR